ncbi:DNA protecting protein DprA [Helicobacter sp. 12S02634-8]|uniref:DNA-processing protein DprA n=1 Tax=Helicobacter sp. 12S02634-8 TaxID=1476199 RepID=UPI000BA78CCF|nr:DNA-processing protein DprA [Helicobacter sp. 12S02634-8]PAF47829.1 DNA protecting protein DprA [Helicobacter sp. 12S02634-8]
MKSHFLFDALPSLPPALCTLQDPPQKLYYTGKLPLLQAKHKIAIIGTRHPTPYTKNLTFTLAKKIAQNRGVVVSGGALGVDIIAQNGALPDTIMVSPSSLDIIYPASNASIITKIAQQGLIVSEYPEGYAPKYHSFIQRNRLVVALSDCVIIPQADLNSGSMQSARLASKYNKPIFVLPQRLDESQGTNALLQKSLAQAIYDIDAFIEMIFGVQVKNNDAFLKFCEGLPTFEEAYLKYGDLVLEYELEGKIMREAGRLKVVV